MRTTSPSDRAWADCQAASGAADRLDAIDLRFYRWKDPEVVEAVKAARKAARDAAAVIAAAVNRRTEESA